MLLALFRGFCLVLGVSWIYSVIHIDVVRGVFGGRELFVVARHLSLVISATLILMAVRPQLLRPLLARSGGAFLFRGLLVVAAILWQWSLVTGPMLGKLWANPLGPALGAGLIFPGGVFLHVVFQHWVQSAIGVLLGVYPQAFRVLIAPRELEMAVAPQKAEG